MFGVPIGLSLLVAIIIQLANGSNISDIVNSATQYGTSVPFPFDSALFLGLFFGLLSIAFAIWFGFSDKIRDFLQDSKKAEVDQKIAMIYNFAQEFRCYRLQNVQAGQLDLVIERILADIRGTARIKNTIKNEQKENLIVAKNRLLAEMRQGNYNQEANRVEEVFRAHLW